MNYLQQYIFLHLDGFKRWYFRKIMHTIVVEIPRRSLDILEDY